MAREKGFLSDLQLRHWIEAGTPMANADGNGLTFTLSTAGVAGWILRYRHGGWRRELTIGRYPDISLADARGIATIKHAEIMQGRNPAAGRQKAKATAAKDWTVRELVKDYRAKKSLTATHTEAPSLIRTWDFIVLPSAFLAMGVRFGDVGMIAFVPAAAMYLAAMVAGRAACRARLAWQVDRAIDLEAWRTSPTKSTQH